MGEHLDRAISLLDEIDGMAFGKVSVALDAIQTSLLLEKSNTEKSRATIATLVEALEKIACFDDETATANEWLEKTGSYASFDEPGSVAVARAAIQLVRGSKGDE